MIRNSRTFDRALSLITLMAIVMASFPVFPRVAEAAPVPVLVEDFGTGADSATITGWEKHEAATILREGQASGDEDVASPNGGRFAKISADSGDGGPHDGYICREIDAEDYTNLTLSYYWNGDFDTETSPAGGGGPDLGIVEARDNGNGDANCGAEGGWDELQSHDLTQDSDSWHLVSELDISDFDGTKFTIRFRNESSATDEWFRVDGIEIEGEKVGDAPTVSACTITNSVVTSDLATWDLSETRATGHNEIEADGLHIWTEGNTSTDKAAGYYTTDFPLSGLGNQTIDDALDYEADFGIEPGLQLVVDFDNNGTTDGILVGEKVYGENWWLTGSSQQFVKDDAPHTGGGNGSDWFGTVNEWLEEFPTAQVKAIGYSLGSGVHGDGVIKSINLGCTEYTFAKDASSEVIIVSDDTSAGENLPGWMFNRDPGTDTPFVFDTEQASMPDGSLHVLPIGANASDKFIAENFINTPIADIESISYDFMIGSGGEDTDEEQFYMNVYANFGVSDDLKFYDCRYNIVPTVGSTAGFTTVTFDPTEDYPVTQRGDSPFTCPASPADMDDLSPGSNVRVFALNVGDTSASDVGLDGYLDKVVTVIDEGDNIHTTTYNFEPEQTATVEICKFNEEEDRLDGWTLMLLGDKVETVNVPSNGSEVFSTNNLDGDYAFIANGSYIYRPGYTGSTTDAAYSMRTDGNDPIDPTGHPFDPWVRVNDFNSPYEGYLGITVDGALGTTDWGNIFNPLHEYALQYNGEGNPAGFKIVDSAYGDNSGSLSVDIYEGYVGVTGEDGCVEFSDVPYGENYEIDEIMQEGWSNVSGLGPVEVNGESNSFTVVNTEGPKQCVDDLDGDWADNVVSFDQGNRKNGSAVLEARSDEEDALGESDWTSGGSTGFVSLGFGGSIVVSFDSFVPNVEGNDISIHEATNGTYPAETALIEVSQTGEDDDWYEVGTSTSATVSYFDFDSTGLAWIKYVRVTDTTNPAIHANDADGFDLDAVDATQTVCAEPEEPQMCSVTVVSDDTNFVQEKENNAVLSWAHAAWTAVIDGAEWIWGTYQVEDPTVDTTQTFVKEFEWSGGIASATLDIATDNSYVVTLNGVEVASSTDENNFQIGTQDSYDLSSYVEVGVNTLEIEVLNKGVPNSTPTGNPAGLKYNLTVVSDETGEDCKFAPEADLEITRPETEDQVLSGEYTFEAEYIDADDNADPVQWAIRAGTCNSGSGTVAGNVDSFNTPYMWNGASFSSTIDMDEWEEGEYCFVVNPTEDGGTNFRETRWFTLEHPEPTQCLIVSDTSTLVVDNNDFAVETWDEHNNWTHDIADATWIWDSFYVEDPEATTTRTFKETFNVTEVGAAELDIAADNTYTVYINGDLVVERLNANNYQTPDEYDVTSFIDEGENELEIIVTNIGTDDSIPKSNPAGLLFRLEIETDGGQCLSTTEPDDGEPEPTPTYEVFGFAWNDDNTNDVKDGEEGYLAGVAVEITNGSTTVATTTDAGGRYYFTVPSDNWTLSAALSGWYLTYPNTSSSTHEIVVAATSSGPYDFGLDANEVIDEDDGGSDAVNNDDDNNDDNNDDDGNDGPDGQVAGTSTTFGVGGGIDLWEDLRNEIGNSGGPFGSVLGATAEAQELDATTTIEVGDDGATPSEDDEENTSAPWKNWLCDYLWLLPLLWIIVSALAYWRKESYEDPRAMLWTQIIFGAVAFILLVTYFIWEVPCAWVPSAIVAIGSAVMSYYGKE